MTASYHRPVTHRRSKWRWLRVLLAVTVLTTLMSAQVPARPVRGDGLSDAIAQQKKLSKLIADQKAQMAQLAVSQTKLQGQISRTKATLASVSANLNDVQAEVTSLRKDISAVQARYNGLVAQVADLQRQLVDLEAQERAKQAELEQRRSILARRLVAAYQTDQTSLIEQLLTAHSITDVMSDVSYYMDMGAADKALAEQIQADQRTLAEVHQSVQITRDGTQQLAAAAADQKKQLDAQMVQLNAAEAKLASLKKQVAAQLAAQKAAERKLEANKAELAAAIKANGAAQAALGKKIDELVAAQAARGGIPSQFSGSLKWPMGGQMSQDYGCTGFPSEPPVGNCAHFHQGIDLVAPCGTPVRSSGAGVVVFVGYNPYDSYPPAWIVIVAHSSSLDTWYAHMAPSRPGGIYQGASVGAGQIVGWEASTGHSTGCHLHWAVRYNDNFVNPRLFV